MILYERVSETFSVVFEHPSVGVTIFDAGYTYAEQVSLVNEAIKKQLTEQKAVMHFDKRELISTGS